MKLSKFETYLIEEQEQILEFANLGPKDHKFGVDVKLHIMQPADKQLQHGPRIKVFKKGFIDSFTVTLTKIPQVIGDYSKIITKTELNTLIEHINHYKDAFLAFWYDPNMDISEIYAAFDQIDKGFTIEIQNRKYDYK